jgi:hypothetical protein
MGDAWGSGVRWGSWDIAPVLAAAPALNAVTILEELQRRYPEEVSPALLRTLQRRLRQWRASHGVERELYFAQEHVSRRLGLSDFTDCAELDVTVAGQRFPHRLYQFALAYSGWRHVEVVLAGESFEALANGLQNRAVATGRSSTGTSHGLAVGRVPQSDIGGRRGSDSALRIALRALRHARVAQQSRCVARERSDRVAARNAQEPTRASALSSPVQRVPASSCRIIEAVRFAIARSMSSDFSKNRYA